MHRPSEGMRRLGIVVGVVGALTWIILFLRNVDLDRITPGGWVLFLIGSLMCFGLGFTVFWGIDWVMSGFREGKNESC
jgi:hypothetical protein